MFDFSGYEKYSYLFELFDKISSIPRGSGNTSGIADYLVSFARERGLEYLRDSQDNVIIRKKATPGLENAPAVILQGHSDIVAERSPDSDKDMLSEGLDLYRDGDFLRAHGTTLGADDGVALVYALAVLDGRAEAHPDVEAVFTSDEETGLFGAAALDGRELRGRLLLNIDSDREGIFTVGCAGGMQVCVSMPVTRESYAKSAYKLTVSGLAGGHSGVDIHLRRENATHLLAEALSKLGEVRIASLSGGTKDNAIPRSAECVFYSCEPKCPGTCEVFEPILAKYREHEPEVSISLEAIACDAVPLDFDSSSRLIKLLYSLPTGIVAMSPHLKGEVETSLNLGITRLNDEELSLSFYLRSSREGATDALYSEIAKICSSLGATATVVSSYPAWEYNPDSPLRERLVSLYREKYGREPVVNTIHAGLECGIIAAKVEGLDCVSMGPDNYALHTTEEHLSMSSFVSVWEFLNDFLKQK